MWQAVPGYIVPVAGKVLIGVKNWKYVSAWHCFTCIATASGSPVFIIALGWSQPKLTWRYYCTHHYSINKPLLIALSLPPKISLIPLWPPMMNSIGTASSSLHLLQVLMFLLLLHWYCKEETPIHRAGPGEFVWMWTVGRGGGNIKSPLQWSNLTCKHWRWRCQLVWILPLQCSWIGNLFILLGYWQISHCAQ